MNIHRPSASSDEQLHGDSAAVRSKFKRALTATHSVRIVAAIELWATLAEAEQRRVAGLEVEPACRGIEPQLLEKMAALPLDSDLQRGPRQLQCQVSGFHC